MRGPNRVLPGDTSIRQGYSANSSGFPRVGPAVVALTDYITTEHQTIDGVYENGDYNENQCQRRRDREMKRSKAWADKPIEIYLNALGYKEEGEWIALALEMDIRGYGATFDEALRDLFDLVTMQIGFAIFKKQPSMIFHPADPKYFMLFQELRDKKIQRFGLESEEEEFAIRGMPLPPPHLIAAQYKDHFQPTHG